MVRVLPRTARPCRSNCLLLEGSAFAGPSFALAGRAPAIIARLTKYRK